MNISRPRSRRRLLAVVFVAVLLLAAGIAAYALYQDRELSSAEISNKFDCNRMTADYRETDVFCINPKFYNDPSAITFQEYYDYSGCDERLKEGAPSESLKENDPLYYNAYHTCRDKTKLDAERKIFIANLKSWKANN